jgi:glycosyltransferase involved in cell wall biosynthesis
VRLQINPRKPQDRQKNARLLGRTLRDYYKRDASTRFVLIGKASDSVQVGASPVTSLGRVPREELGDLLSAARICLISSRWEGSHISGHEALASGCTIVGTPIPAVQSMIGEGRWGTIAAGHTPRDLAQALGAEMRVWQEGERDPVAIAAHWRRKLLPHIVAGHYLSLMSSPPN